MRRVCISVALLLGVLLGGCTAKKPETPKAPPSSPIAFESVGEAAGLHFAWPKQARPMRNLEAFGCGCAFFDYDNDGWQDILLVSAPHAVIYHNLKNGHFEEVTAALGLDKFVGDWKGCAIGDYNGDGALDIVLTGYRCLALLQNQAGKRFIDQTTHAGLSLDNHGHWGASAGFMDLAGNGRLDLVVLNYVVFGPKEKQYCEPAPGVKSGCPPSDYKPEFANLYENLGGGRLRDASTIAGLAKTSGKALVVAFNDINDDGKVDLYIGNDGTPAEMLVNQGKLHFANQGLASGVAYGMQAHAMAAMGADWGDYDGDGRLDLAVPGFSNESYMLFHALDGGLFEQVSEATRLAAPTYKPLGFGTKWLDFENDGWPDLLFANGHVYDNVHESEPELSFLQPLMLFHNENGKTFTDLAPTLGGAVAEPILGRGLATGDYDNDGRVDFLVVDYENKPRLFHNSSVSQNHWLTLELRGAPNSGNRFVYGARVTVRAGKRVWTALVSPASSYLSSSDPRIHFGLGAITQLDSVTVEWPGGVKETVSGISIDQFWRIEPGKAAAVRISLH